MKKSRYFVYLLEKKLFEDWISKKAAELISDDVADSISVSNYTPKNSYSVYVVADRLNYSFSQFITQFENFDDYKVGWKILNQNSKSIVRKYLLYMDKDRIDEVERLKNNNSSIKKFDKAKNDIKVIIEGIEDLYSIFADMKEDGWYFSLSKEYAKVISAINVLKTKVIKDGFIKDYKETVKNLTDQLRNIAITDQQKFENDRKIKEYNRLLSEKFNTTPRKSDEIYIPPTIEGLPVLVLRMRKKGMSDIEIIKTLASTHHLSKPILGALIYPKNDRLTDYMQVTDRELEKHGLKYDQKAYRLVKEDDIPTKK